MLYIFVIILELVFLSVYFHALSHWYSKELLSWTHDSHFRKS